MWGGKGTRQARRNDGFGPSGCFMIPYGLNLRFFGRNDELRILREALQPGTGLRAIGIHGLGGVGKTQLALQYANTSRGVYQVIAWIPADTQDSLNHAVSDLAKKLGLANAASKDDRKNVGRVRDWLDTAGKSFLLVFDNLDNIELLDQIWPASDQGSIVITTRSPSVASGRTTKTLALALDCFSAEASWEALRSLSQLEFADEEKITAAQNLCHRVGGFPLALMHFGDFMRSQTISYRETEEMFRRSPRMLYTMAGPPPQYDHTADTAPDLVPERLLTETKVDIDGTPLEFVTDGLAFGEAVAELTQTSLITRSLSSKSLSMHPVVKSAVLSKLSESKYVASFDWAARILFSSFRNTWNERGPHQGHGWSSWEPCRLALPHIRQLKSRFEKRKPKTTKPALFAELLFRAGTYLWEIEGALAAKSLFACGSKVSEDLPATITAQGQRLLGHILIDLARPRAALGAYEEALALRESLEGPNSPAVADIHDSIACAYTELRDLNRAFSHLKKATEIRSAHDPSEMARTLAIRAVTCLSAVVSEDALIALCECWRLQGMSQQDIEASKYPKHSGDIMLLGRILWSLNRREEARSLIERARAVRKETYGEPAGPRYADSCFCLALIMEADGKLEAAARALDDIVRMCVKASRMRPHLAQALWLLANVRVRMGASNDSAAVVELRNRAQAARSAIEEREWPDEDTDTGYLRLSPFMLW